MGKQNEKRCWVIKTATPFPSGYVKHRHKRPYISQTYLHLKADAQANDPVVFVDQRAGIVKAWIAHELH